MLIAMKGDSAMLSVKSAITNTIPISNFNRGLAGKIFADVRTSGAKVVIKNNMPECVLLSPEEYVKMVNVIEEAELLKMAISRTENCNPADSIPLKSIMEKYDITQDDIDNTEDVEIE